jgi:hypothetical protein
VDAYEEHSNATVPQWNDLLDRICQLPARTPEGVRAKAHFARSIMREDDVMRATAEPKHRLAWSVFNDVLGTGRFDANGRVGA